MNGVVRPRKFPLVYLLIRRISEYSGPDILLGVFATPADCDRASRSYFDVRQANLNDDPWRKQAYKDCGFVKDDLAIEELPSELTNGTAAFVVSNHSDGFGQIVRTFESIHETFASASSRMEELDSLEDEDCPFPHYTLLDVVVVGCLHSDYPEDQPRPSWQDPMEKNADFGCVRRSFADAENGRTKR